MLIHLTSKCMYLDGRLYPSTAKPSRKTLAYYAKIMQLARLTCIAIFSVNANRNYFSTSNVTKCNNIFMTTIDFFKSNYTGNIKKSFANPWTVRLGHLACFHLASNVTQFLWKPQTRSSWPRVLKKFFEFFPLRWKII